MTLDYEKRFSKISVPANVLVDLGELLVLPDESGQSEPEEKDDKTSRPGPGEE